jgi:DNA-binding Lrp family transcriptional regulator
LLTAFVLLRIKPGMDREVLEKVGKLSQVKEVETVYGEYDMLLKISVETLDDLDTFIFDIIRRISGVEGTTTLISMKVPAEGQPRGS